MDPPGDDNSTAVREPLMDVNETDAYREKIIAFVNPKSYVLLVFISIINLYDYIFSGGLQGQVVFEQLRTQIGEANVYDLVKDHGPQKGLKENQHEKNLRIIGLFFRRTSFFF
jgi:hypothetical protein